MPDIDLIETMLDSSEAARVDQWVFIIYILEWNTLKLIQQISSLIQKDPSLFGSGNFEILGNPTETCH